MCTVACSVSLAEHAWINNYYRWAATGDLPECLRVWTHSLKKRNVGTSVTSTDNFIGKVVCLLRNLKTNGYSKKPFPSVIQTAVLFQTTTSSKRRIEYAYTCTADGQKLLCELLVTITVILDNSNFIAF